VLLAVARDFVPRRQTVDPKKIPSPKVLILGGAHTGDITGGKELFHFGFSQAATVRLLDAFGHTVNIGAGRFERALDGLNGRNDFAVFIRG
jgi:hypothetical protein